MGFCFGRLSYFILFINYKQKKIMKLKGTLPFNPYLQDGTPALKTTGGGCYIIRSSGLFSKVLYVGKSHADLKKTLYRHFQKWTDKRHPENKKQQIWERVTYYGENKNAFTVEVVFMQSIAEIDLLEQALIMELEPRDNKQKFNFFTQAQKTKAINSYIRAESWKPNNEADPF